MAAVELGRKFIGIELNQAYLTEAEKRIKEAMKLELPLDVERVKQLEIMMTDVTYLIDQYWEYLVTHFEGTPSDTIERLVISYSDALWAAILNKTIKVNPCPLQKWHNKMAQAAAKFVNDVREMWEMGE